MSATTKDHLPRFGDGDEDFAIVSFNGDAIKVHRSVLASQSQVFQMMLQSKMRESTENKLVFDYLDKDEVEILVKVLYDDLNVEMDKEQAKNLAFAADQYELTRLTSLCEKVLVDKVEVDNALEMASFGILLKMRKLKNCSLALTDLLLQDEDFQASVESQIEEHPDVKKELEIYQSLAREYEECDRELQDDDAAKKDLQGKIVEASEKEARLRKVFSEQQKEIIKAEKRLRGQPLSTGNHHEIADRIASTWDELERARLDIEVCRAKMAEGERMRRTLTERMRSLNKQISWT